MVAGVGPTDGLGPPAVGGGREPGVVALALAGGGPVVESLSQTIESRGGFQAPIIRLPGARGTFPGYCYLNLNFNVKTIPQDRSRGIDSILEFNLRYRPVELGNISNNLGLYKTVDTIF